MLGFTPYWYYKLFNVIHLDSPGVHTSDKILYLSLISEILLECTVIIGSVVNGKREPKLFSFVSNKPTGYTIFHQYGTALLKKNKRVLITITFVLENDNHKEVDFNGETLTFELQLIEVWTIK